MEMLGLQVKQNKGTEYNEIFKTLKHCRYLVATRWRGVTMLFQLVENSTMSLAGNQLWINSVKTTSIQQRRGVTSREELILNRG